MILPPELRDAIDRLLEGIPLADLRQASERLSARYRAETRDGKAHITNDLTARAYLAARMPATYAAMARSLHAAAALQPDFRPQLMLDVGAGPGTAMLAARACWPSLLRFHLVENSAPIRSLGQYLASRSGATEVRWLDTDLAALAPPDHGYDLVTMGYVLDELDPGLIQPLTERLWAATTGLLVVVEPGTPAGWSRILQVRDLLIAAGAYLVAPCPHHAPCPLAPPDWCHFSARVARSRMHLRVKSADVPWEDEKFIYVAAARVAPVQAKARVIAPPQSRGGTVTLKLCQSDGSAVQRLLSRRNGDGFRQAKRLSWGDAML